MVFVFTGTVLAGTVLAGAVLAGAGRAVAGVLGAARVVTVLGRRGPGGHRLRRPGHAGPEPHQSHLVVLGVSGDTGGQAGGTRTVT